MTERPMILTREEITRLIKLGQVQLRSKPPQPKPSSSQASSQASTSSSSQVFASAPSGSQGKSSKAEGAVGEGTFHWPENLAKKLLDIVVPKKATDKSKNQTAFWREVATELGAGADGTQCRNKYFNLNKTRSSKKSAAHASGGAPANYTPSELYMEDLLSKLKDPIEIPENAVHKVSSPLAPTNNGEPSGQAAVEKPYRKKPKTAHGSGTRHAVVRNTLQNQWIHYLKRSDERHQLRQEKEVRKVALMAEVMGFKREKLEVEKERLKFVRNKYEQKKLIQKRKEEQMKRLIEIEEERLVLLKNMLIAAEH